jgi:putative membrane protein
MRFFGLYLLSFETAGQSAEGALVSLIGINDAEIFREAILKQKDSLSGHQTATLEKTEAPISDITSLTQSVQNIEKMLTEILANKK